MLPFVSVAFFTILLHSLLPIYAIPLEARQAAETVTTVNTALSPLGTVTVTCVLVFTPVQDDQGRDVVQEVKTCVLAVDGSQSSSVSSTVTTATTPTISPSTSTAILPSATSSSSPLESSFPITTSTPIPTDVTGGFPTGFTTTSTIQAVPLDTGTTSTISIQASAVGVSGIAAAATISMPGKQLSVLPIGLGVFAGISIIALIVVGLVTYERTKYRKAFRQRKLAETAAPLGYGGMSY